MAEVKDRNPPINKSKSSRKKFFAYLPRLGSKERINNNDVTNGGFQGSKLPKEKSSDRKIQTDRVTESDDTARIGSKGTLKELYEALDEANLEEVRSEDDIIERTKSSSPTPSATDRSNGLKPTASFIRSLKERYEGAEYTAEMRRLEAAIHNKLTRHRLVDALLTLKDDSTVKIHFISAVDEYLLADGKDRKEKGARIVQMFIVKQSMFRLKNVSSQHQQALIAKHYECLEGLRFVCLQELTQSEVVLKALEDVF